MDKKQQTKEKILNFLNSAFVPVIFILIWQFLSGVGFLNELFLPSPVKVFKAFIEMAKSGVLFDDIWVSAKRVLWGCFWGILIGLSLGIVSGLFSPLAKVLEPIIDAIRQISVYAWIPLIILWFGIGETSKIIIIGRSVMIPVYVNCLSGIRDVRKEYMELAEVLELSRSLYLRKVLLPAATPSIFTGLRLAAGNAWTSVVAAEMLGGLTGLGYALLHAKDYMRSDQLIALMFVIAIIGMLLDLLLRLLEKRIFRWKEA